MAYSTLVFPQRKKIFDENIIELADQSQFLIMDDLLILILNELLLFSVIDPPLSKHQIQRAWRKSGMFFAPRFKAPDHSRRLPVES